MRRYSLALIIFSCFLSCIGCSQDCVENCPQNTQSITIQDAKSFYDQVLSGSNTKSYSAKERNNMFFRENFVPEWNLALQTKTDKVESVDVPVKDERHYFVTSFDGKGFYLTRCFHSITIVRAVESKEIGV